MNARQPSPLNAPPSWPKRLLWFVGLWAAGVATTALIGFVIRFWLT